MLPVSGSFCDRDFVPPPDGVHAAGAARLAVSPVRTNGFRGLHLCRLRQRWSFIVFILLMFPLFLCFLRVSA